MLVHTKLQK